MNISNEVWFIPVDILAIISIGLVILLSVLYLCIIIFDKACHTIPMMLTGNTCLVAFLAACCILSMCIFTLKNDLKQIDHQDSLCIFRGYTAYAVCALFNLSFLLQAIYRYITVVYPARLFWQTIKVQFLLICFIWIFSFVYPFVFAFTNEITYNVDNQICQLPFKLSFSIIYVVHFAYLLPVLAIMFIYFKLVRYVRHMNKRITPANTLNRARRELKMVQRTVIIILILVTLCFPYALFIVMSFFTPPPKYHFRISYLFADISILSVMIALFQFTDSLKEFVWKKIKRPSNVVPEART